MPFTPLSHVSRDCLRNIHLIATDMDGTLTSQEKFTPALLQALLDLAVAQIQVLVVTGRSAGWVNGLAHYLPIKGAIAENGGIFYSNGGQNSISLVPIQDWVYHRNQLAEIFGKLQLEFPHLRESDDNRYRLTDWTFDVEGLTQDEIDAIDNRCRTWGWSITYSTVQVHIKRPQQTKANGLQQVLARCFPELTPEQIITVGDSPNDESLFDAALFPCSVGVANVTNYRDRLAHQPTYVTEASEGKGFCELSRYLLETRSSKPQSHGLFEGALRDA